jgi:2-polyprenyl-6-methoxyphenol hydroxylase-like FAD-dependent oxidoreductase
MVRIAIIGGGIGGLTTAIALRQFGFDPQVYEQAPALLDVGAAIAIWPNAMRVLQKLKLADAVLEHAGQIKAIQWLDQNGRLINSVSLTDLIAKSPAVALHRADLQEILLQALPPGCIHLGNSFTDYNQNIDQMVLSFANGNSIETDVLVGADGIHSRVRTKFLNHAPPNYRGYMVWRGIAQNAPASLPKETAIELHGKGKRFGIGPVGIGRIGWWAAANAANTSTTAEERSGDRKTWKQGEHVSSKQTQDTRRELLRLFDGWHRPVLQLIEATPSGSILKTGAFDRPSSRLWGQQSVTLLGDAIHPMTPNFGQGGCMAIEDAMILARSFEKYGAEERTLRRYEEFRRSRTKDVTRYSRLYGAIGQWQNIFARGLRKSALSLVPENLARRLMQIVFDYDAGEVRI